MHRIRRNSSSFALGLAALLASGLSSAAGLTPDLLVDLNRLSDPSVSNSGTRVVYTLRSTDREANRGRTDLWLLELGNPEQAEPWQLTTHSAGDFNGRFSADDQWIYFLSTRSGSSQVWRLSLSGGDPMPVTDYPIGVQGFKLSADNRNLIVALAIIDECGIDLACSHDALTATPKNSAQVYERLFVRHWDSWDKGTVNALFAQPLNKQGKPDGTLVHLSRKLNVNVPSRPFGGMEEVAIAPDGRTVVFAARVRSQSEAWSTNLDLYQVPIKGGRAKNLTQDNLATDTAPVFARDGSALYWLAMSRPGFEADRFRIMRRTSGNEAIEIAPDWDRSPGGLSMSRDGNSLYAIANDNGRRRLFEIPAMGGNATALTAFGWVNSVAPAAAGPLVALDSLHQPADLYQLGKDDGGLYRLTNVNKAKLSGVQFGVYEQFQFAGWNNETVSGYVMQPVGAVAGRKYPIAFLIHGGPQGSFGDHFHYRWNPQTYAAQGYAVVFIDFHGSTGYGQAFTDSISGDWGGKPLVDLQKGLAAASERYNWLNADKVCALGASYGGYMVNWIAGNWPERFDCLVNHDGVFDNRMMYYSTEELWFPEWEHGGPYYAASAQHEKHNPVNFVQNWQTPMLVIHGALDYRIPETQGIAAFTALQRRGIDSQFLFFPDENHWVLKPANSVQWHKSVNAWLAKYLK